MTWRSPTGPLVHEHRVIERLVAVMDARLERLGDEACADARFVDAATDFVRTYADRCHHGKEEHILFAALARKPLPPELAEAMRDLIADHVHGRELTRRLVDANDARASGDETAFETIAATMRELIEFYPWHIEKEDKHFFKECLPYLSAEEQARMLVEYDEADRKLIHDKYLGVVEDLERSSAR